MYFATVSTIACQLASGGANVNDSFWTAQWRTKAIPADSR
jgi:hypothetical protein